MIELEKRFIEDDFDPEVYRQKFIDEKDKLIQNHNENVKYKILFKITAFFIMVAALALGSVLYTFLARLIQAS